jgi:4-amino-4-deoxy-L-arabinose transferase-like glycosyltransferase
MTASGQTTTPPALTPAVADLPSTPVERSRAGARLRYLGLAVVVAVSAVLNTVKLSQNGYANIFYSAGVRSMLHSLHNFLFVSFDPGGLVSVDKPPLALWLQVASAKLFGFSPLSLLLPEAIAGVLTVALLYMLLDRRMGTAAAFAGALTLAVFPSFVAVSRENGVDPLLILLMLLACGAGLRATETGSWRWLLTSGVLVGLAFNCKTLAACLVIPGIAVAYLVCAPGSLGRRAAQLLSAGVVMVVVAFAWIAFVESTPASKRPYVGSSTNNTELGLTFEYNGFGRVEGQVGGPGRVPVRPGARVSAAQSSTGGRHPARSRARSRAKAPPPRTPVPPASASSSVRNKLPIPFGGPPGPLRLFGVGLGDQGGWMLPFALFGLLGVALLTLLGHRLGDPSERVAATPRRRDPRLASVLVLGGWFVVEAVLLSTSKGIVHPYYVSALAPGTAAMVGAGAVAFVWLARVQQRGWGVLLAACAATATVATQLVLMHREHYMVWFIPFLVAGTVAGLGVLVITRRLAAPAVALVLCLLLVAPTAYATSTWLAPVQGTFPAAGPRQAAGTGGVGVSRGHLASYLALFHYVRGHRPGSRWQLFTDAATTVAPFILLGMDAGALAGYSGTDPAIDGRGLARLVARGKARYVVLGGEFSSRGGNGATAAVLRACEQISPEAWQNPDNTDYGLTLFDCAGHERALASG